MSALPASVKKQIAKADKLAAEYARAAAGEPPAEEAPPAAAAPAQTPEPAPSAAPPAAEAPPAAPEAQSPPSTPPPPTPIQREEVSWEQRYKVLQGKYNAEVPRLTGQIRDLTTMVKTLQDSQATMQGLLASLGQRQGSAPADDGTSRSPAGNRRLVKDEEITTFGADLHDFVARTARDAVAQDLEAKVAPVVKRVDAVANTATQAAQKAAQADEALVVETLTRMVPNWKQLNEDDSFNDWLDGEDPYNGALRRDMLNQAFKRHDAPRVVAFFTGYLKEHATIAPPPPAAEPQVPAPQRRLEDFVAPGAPKANTGGAQEGSGKRVWTASEISAHYRNVSQGKYRTKPEQLKSIEADIFAAQKEGRIRP